ncbi:XisI protein [Anaerolineales bacterium HSG24]|nr:XisI protein [Anaerolineales bacterium HSG24]
MDSIRQYQQILYKLLQTHAHKPSHGDIKPEIVVDRDEKHYELMHVGWQGAQRVHGCVLHIDIVGDKIWIQHDGTHLGVASELVEAGIPPEKIILGFRPEHVRQYTGYGVG